MSGSQDGDSGGRSGSSSNKHTLRPVTIRQVRSAEQASPDSDFRVDGVELGQLSLCAVVRNVARNATNVSYSVEDGTGTIEVKQWLDNSSDDAAKSADVQQNTYVRILGTLKSFQNKQNIVAGHIRPVENYNEVLFHKMEAVWVHLQLTQGGAGAAGGAGADKGFTSSASNAAATSVGDFSSIASPTQRKIAQAIQLLVEPESEGLTVQQVATKVPGLSIDQIK